MSLRRGRLYLGPIVGHTDHRSTRIWIQAAGDPFDYTLRVLRCGDFPFVSTESKPEFGTALALVDGLRPDLIYRYRILFRGRSVPDGVGTFRTMPDPNSLADVSFVAVSCSHQRDLGKWEELATYIEESQPRFLILMGDQVYMDQEDPNIWDAFLESEPRLRRRAMAAKYRQSWSREPLRKIFATTPTYMMWDDHDIRDGWGSWALDSPSLAEAHSRGRPTFEKANHYFEDARDVYWHFQMCHNPPPSLDLLAPEPPAEAYTLGLPPKSGMRQAMPFVFRCGRLAVVMVDSRGDRDLWRDVAPVLGQVQWEFLRGVFEQLSTDIDALALVTPVPIVAGDPDGQAQFLLGRRTDDIELFKDGKEEELLSLMRGDEKEGVHHIPLNALSGWASSRLGVDLNWGSFKNSDIDDARDQWCNHLSRSEQERLIREAGRARLVNRLPRYPRGLIFVGGDLHSGGLFEVTVTDPPFTATCLISSGISQKNDIKVTEPLVDTLVDREFSVAPGVHVKLKQFFTHYNFGTVQVLATGEKPRIIPAVIADRDAAVWGIKLNLTPLGVP